MLQRTLNGKSELYYDFKRHNNLCRHQVNKSDDVLGSNVTIYGK